jgi:hypothetical protein
VLCLTTVEELLPLIIAVLGPVVKLTVCFALSLLTFLAHFLYLLRFFCMAVKSTPEFDNLLIRFSVYLLQGMSPA